MAGDPYEEVLGIPPDVRPVDYYTLLGLQRFCDDADKIDASFSKGVLNISLPKKPEAMKADKVVPIKGE